MPIDRNNARILLIGYVLIALFGAGLLMLPAMHRGELAFIDAFFTTSSAISVTGLIVKSNATDFSFGGQLVILCLIQLGGFGYMSLGSALYLMLRKNINHSNAMLLKENLAYPTTDGLGGFLKRMFLITLSIEACGALILTLRFMLDFSPTQALWQGIFHSISAFNNAGFSIFAQGLMPYRDDVVLNLTITTLIIIGGIGYFVLVECYLVAKGWKGGFSLHSKIVLIMTAILLVVAFFSVFLLEYHNAKSIGDLSLGHKILSSYFAAVNYRTSGFNTLDLSLLQDPTLFFSSIFMVIGGAPGGTAGGVKVTTIAIIFLHIFYTLRGSMQVKVYNRAITPQTISKAYVVVILSALYIVLALMALCLFEDGGSRGFLALLFEICSAFGTVGLSMGDGGVLSLSAHFTPFGKSVIIILMLCGKVGIFAFCVSMIIKEKSAHIGYLPAKILI
ncbi:potassium transporter [Helicobacter sp. MIT 00-7814]|uniref:TrkH family potassium uptake protein n=1 Tax=unclassified Helicobacter TaxID=2593540 RepID=UPI000E1E4E24|nr:MULTISPECIES: TrkH family potassium uptake protein [unclassified Helicobacter]RDU54621.1 potassium transporter [Helicobacter sp. MIT 00-7814]RDU54680.1 potassium transporter [Helicobacter sp. MIT 99-10781]